MKRFLAFAVVFVSLTLPAQGQGILGLTISGGTVTATVSLPGGLGGNLLLTFEDVSGLSSSSLGVSAQLVNILNPAFLARLPHNVIPALPVLLRIEPPSTGALSFTGIVTMQMHTSNLLYILGSPLRLYRAPIGGSFEDMTASIGSGSYRARGTSGGFSEFLIVLDLRSLNQVIANKLDALDDELGEYAAQMPSSLHTDLAARLAAVRTDVGNSAWHDAIQDLDGFEAVVEEHSGTDIPNVWRAARDVDNVAGYLRAGALTLRFSIGLKPGA